MAKSDSPLRITLENDDRLLRLTLARPKKNIVDAAMLNALRAALADHQQTRDLAAVLIDADGPNFSFGASVEEHLPEQCAAMLKTLHGLLQGMIAFPLPILVAVRGYCLGGGLEVACAGSFIFAAPDAQFAQPEIQLGVFAPAASCLLPERIGQARAEDLLFSGRSMDAVEALAAGLIMTIAEHPEQAAKLYIETQLLPRSSFALRHAVAAARHEYLERVRSKLDWVENFYLQQLMQGEDPREGLRAFLEKRSPVWKNQ
ncbi:MAG: cyclohexa-1,5-diene-1-carboxyl-CoA hydratase [Gammaproteobacteria bacterium]|nr:cyclohexa-1,5-diene-1-carboxyl-CoA hydratase [Gammaproteobacteria bacterium]